jgi:hypothetical protein
VVEREFAGPVEELDLQPGPAHGDRACSGNWGGERHHLAVVDAVDVDVGTDGGGDEDNANVCEPPYAVMSQVGRCPPTE